MRKNYILPKSLKEIMQSLENQKFSGKKQVMPCYPALSTVVAKVAYIIQHYCALLLAILHGNYVYNESSSYGR